MVSGMTSQLLVKVKKVFVDTKKVIPGCIEHENRREDIVE
jgi:hypothetical protein